MSHNGDDVACVWCGDPITGFRDVLSAKEFDQSGLCQACQDKIFVPQDVDKVDYPDST